jgi:hypothetical protein
MSGIPFREPFLSYDFLVSTLQIYNRKRLPVKVLIWVYLIIFNSSPDMFSQPEVYAWGNMRGIRVDGQLMDFESRLVVAGSTWLDFQATAKERQLPQYTRDNNRQIVTTRLQNFHFVQTVEHTGKGKADIKVQVKAEKGADVTGIFFMIDFPSGEIFTEFTDTETIYTSVAGVPDDVYLVSFVAEGLSIKSPGRFLNLTFEQSTEVFVKQSKTNSHITEVYITIHKGFLEEGHETGISFKMQAGGEIDNTPVEVRLDTSTPGRIFDGFGGNFRLQNPRTDPMVIRYKLDNLGVEWGRVEMPWRFWHPYENNDPVQEANEGNLHPAVSEAMEMAQKLYRHGMPVMIAVWSGPDWAIEGEYSPRPGPGGVWGNPLNKEKMEQIYESISAYITYMKDNYGVEAAMFSFNESDLGINIRQTAEEHKELIIGLGSEFTKKGLKTKLLLGDTADANGYEFVFPAMFDTETHPYLGAVSFHSWRGWETETLARWDEIARVLNIPLIVGEGSIDAAAWRYPAFFEEPVYAMEEINLYVRILDICQPLTILQWQLTADYSMLSGGGVFGNFDKPLQPTQRFWNMKQFSSAPPQLRVMGLSSSSDDISGALLGSTQKGVYVIHLVNNGPARKAVIKDVPESVRKLKIVVTNQNRNMEELRTITVTDNQTEFILEPFSYISLFSIE